MEIGAISGYGMYDYSWYSPARVASDDDGFDAALDALDAADDLNQAGVSFGVQEMPEEQHTYARVEPVDNSNDIMSDSMRRDFSTMKVDMENLHIAAMGFHTRRRIELLEL